MNRTSAFWYAVGAAIIIAGLTASIFGAISDVRDLQTSFVRFVVPGASDLHVSKPGPYVIYYEYRSVVDGEIFDTPESTDIKCTATDRSGTPLEITPASLNTEYDFGGRAGRAIAQFTTPQPGTYVIACNHIGAKGVRIALAIAPPVAAGFISSIFKWLAVALGSIGFGLVVLIVTLVRRAGPGPRPMLR